MGPRKLLARAKRVDSPMAQYQFITTHRAIKLHRENYGDQHFVRICDQLIEEMAELTRAIMHCRRQQQFNDPRFDAQDVAWRIENEIADVHIYLASLQQCLGSEMSHNGRLRALLNQMESKMVRSRGSFTKAAKKTRRTKK